MAKRDEYPENKSLMARQQAVIRGMYAGKRAVDAVLLFWDQMQMPDEVRTMVRRMLDEAVEAIELASEASGGD